MFALDVIVQDIFLVECAATNVTFILLNIGVVGQKEMGMPNLPQNLCGKVSLHRARRCAPQNRTICL
jgi:hypothetical protein